MFIVKKTCFYMKKSKNFKIINLNQNIENTPIIKEGNNSWVLWGLKNDYPIQLLNLYSSSPVHKSCCDFLATCVLGQGIDWQKMKLEGAESYPNFNDSWQSFLYKISLDYIIFGGFAFQIIKNRDNKTYSYYHQPFATVRLEKADSEGDINFAYLCKDWQKTNTYKPQRIELLNFTDDKKVAMGKSYLFYFADYNCFDDYYPNPYYSSALNSIQSDAKLQTFDLSAIVNNFTPSGILTLNPVSDDEERESILKNINATFSDADNANNLIITFKNSNEDMPVAFTPIQSSNEGVNLFSDTNERVVNRIMAAHRIPSKALIGMPMDSTGFSNEGSLLQTAYQLLELTHIAPMRNKIFGYINTLFAMNGIDTQLIIKPLSFNLTANTSEQPAVAAKEIDDENINYDDKITTNTTN